MYFVGINIGLDKTTVSRSPGYNGEPVSQIPLKLANCKNEESIETAICKKDGKWSLVYDVRNFRSDDIRSDFKGPISRLSRDNRDALRVFVELIFQNILEYYSDLRYISPDNKNFEIGIACPSAWVREDSNAQQAYLNFFRNEYGVPVDFCMKENDATYYRCEGFNREASVFVIDVGTSVTDFSTYVKSKCIQNCYWGRNLGTHRIVDALIPHILQYENNSENLYKLQEFRRSLGVDLDIWTRLELFVQEAVDCYFFEKHDCFRLEVTYNYLTPSWSGPKWDRCIEFEASKEEFNKIIDSYTSAVKDALVNTKIRLDRCGITPTKVLLSGSSTGVSFIREYVEQRVG